MQTNTPIPMVTNDEIARFLGVGDDTRRAILRALGLPKRRRHAWSEIWAALGLDPVQPEEIRDHLTHGAKKKNTLWDVARVAEETGNAASTVNGWCRRKAFSNGFPPPILDFRHRTRLWLPIEVRAYVEPAIYRDLASLIRRKARPEPTPAPAAPLAWHGTLQPLPPPAAVAAC
jgi:hypothetical protein